MYWGFPAIKRYMHMVVTAIAVTTFVVSCKDEETVEPLDLKSVPVQTVKGMNAVQTSNGVLQMRMESPLMQRYENDTVSYELFPEGFDVFAYNGNGELETQISSNVAKHTTTKTKEERWEAFGNVVITNFIKGERMETDTLYWDREKGKIFTHAFVKMFSPDGYMQGYGMESDEMARNAYIKRPFNSYGIISRDSASTVYIDTVNFIGPAIK